MNAAASLEALGHLNSIGLHRLKGELAAYWSIKVNGPWRIIFRFEGGDAFDVEILDTHRGAVA